MLKIIGGLIIAWGVLDFGLSWMNTDLYGEVGIKVSDSILPWLRCVLPRKQDEEC